MSQLKTAGAVLMVFATSGIWASVPGPFSDGFEAQAVNAFWTAESQFGTIALSSDQHHSGSQALKFSSSPGFERYLLLKHDFEAPVKGTFTVWFYDVAPGQQTLYEYMQLYNSVTKEFAYIGTRDFDPYCYSVQSYNYNDNISHGPGAPCGTFHEVTTANAPRTAGWHKFQIIVGEQALTFTIDDVQVYSRQADFAFDRVGLTMSGPGWRPDTIAYFDDFSYMPLQAAPPAPLYSVCPLYDPTKAAKSGSTIPIKLQVCDPAGNNISSPTLTVHAVGLAAVSSSISGPVEDAGNANPDNDFRYDATLGNGGGYIFNANTKGLATGTYRLAFSIGDDINMYYTPFQIR